MKKSTKVFLSIALILIFASVTITPSLSYANSYVNYTAPLFTSPMPPNGGSGEMPQKPSQGNQETMMNPILANDGSQSEMVKDLKAKLSQMPLGSLTEEEKSSVQSMMEYEKMVRDVYAIMYEKWQTQAFENLGKKASAAMAAIKLLLDRYNLENPVKDATKVGDFKNVTLQKMLNAMVSKGDKSLKDALEACAEAEEMNMAKIENALKTCDSADLKLVYETLLNETIQMLKSIVYTLSIEGVTYKPKYLPIGNFDKLMGIEQSGTSGNEKNNQTNNSSNSQKETGKNKMVMIMTIGEKTMEINGKKIEFDVAPMIKNNRTLVPIRAIIESMGGKIYWDPTERKVTIVLGNKTIELWIGKAEASVNGESVWIDPANHNVVPVIVPPGRTMLPLRFILEELGATVTWNAATETITITYLP